MAVFTENLKHFRNQYVFPPHLNVYYPDVGDLASQHDLTSELIIEHPLGLLQVHAGAPAHADLGYNFIILSTSPDRQAMAPPPPNKYSLKSLF